VQFLRDPTEASLSALSADGNGCWDELQASTAHIQQLDGLVASGNALAAQLLARHLGSLGGGELGDAHRALGQFGALHIEEFLHFASSGVLTSRNVADAITMLPLEIDENPGAHLEEMLARRAALERVSDPQLAEIRRVALAAVDTFIEEIERAKAAIDAESRQ
jgi:hypothetical protein